MKPDQPIPAWRVAVPTIYSDRYAFGQNKGTNRLKTQVELNLCNRFAVGDKFLLAESGTDGVRTSLLEGGRHVVSIAPARSSDFSFKDSQFDTFIAMNALTASFDWKEMLRAWSRAVRQQGRITFSAHSMDHIVKVAQSRKVSVEDILAIEKATNPFAVPVRLKVNDIIEEANQFGLSVLAIVPYGGIYGRLTTNFWLQGSLADGHQWERLLSWLAVNEGMFQFGLFLEERCLAPLTSIVTDQFFVVLQKTADPERNQQWLIRNEAINAMLNDKITARSLSPFLGEDFTPWKSRLNALLADPFNQTFLAFLYFAFVDYPDAVMFGDFIESCHLAFSEKTARTFLLDDQSYQFVTTWHTLPQVQSCLNYDGTNLGPCLEYSLMEVVLEKARVTLSE